jgi:hypothetical protein
MDIHLGKPCKCHPTFQQISVWVRWPDGPDVPPANASATSGHRSAIISFWARHREGTGDFAGRQLGFWGSECEQD